MDKAAPLCAASFNGGVNRYEQKCEIGVYYFPNYHVDPEMRNGMAGNGRNGNL